MCWQTIVRFFTNRNAIHEAVREGRIVKIAGLLSYGLNIDSYYGGYTPLQLSLLIEQYHCTLFLLKYGANPNLPCHCPDSENQGPTIQPYLKIRALPHMPLFATLKQRNESIIRLLTLYGATNVVFPLPCPEYQVLPGFRKIYDEAQSAREKIAILQYKLSERPLIATYDVYTQLQQIWQKFADDEQNPTFKTHYEEKADLYKRKAGILRIQIPIEEKTTARPTLKL